VNDPITFDQGGQVQPGLVTVTNATGGRVDIHRPIDGEKPHVLDGTCWCGPTVEMFGGEPAPTIGSWPGDQAPMQRTPLTSSEDRMHVLDETCWCLPNVLAEGQGDDFRILEVDHRGQITVGDRVAVDDPALAQLEAIVRAAGEDPAPNNRGWVEHVSEDGTLLIVFDDHGSAPYPRSQTRRIA
jgi:hypothetical protein